jgi:hypothetical protein
MPDERVTLLIVPATEQLQKLSRKELKELCKLFGLQANKPQRVLIQELEGHRAVSSQSLPPLVIMSPDSLVDSMSPQKQQRLEQEQELKPVHHTVIVPKDLAHLSKREVKRLCRQLHIKTDKPLAVLVQELQMYREAHTQIAEAPPPLALDPAAEIAKMETEAISQKEAQAQAERGQWEQQKQRLATLKQDKIRLMKEREHGHIPAPLVPGDLEPQQEQHEQQQLVQWYAEQTQRPADLKRRWSKMGELERNLLALEIEAVVEDMLYQRIHSAEGKLAEIKEKKQVARYPADRYQLEPPPFRRKAPGQGSRGGISSRGSAMNSRSREGISSRGSAMNSRSAASSRGGRPRSRARFADVGSPGSRGGTPDSFSGSRGGMRGGTNSTGPPGSSAIGQNRHAGLRLNGKPRPTATPTALSRPVFTANGRMHQLNDAQPLLRYGVQQHWIAVQQPPKAVLRVRDLRALCDIRDGLNCDEWTRKSGWDHRSLHVRALRHDAGILRPELGISGRVTSQKIQGRTSVEPRLRIAVDYLKHQAETMSKAHGKALSTDGKLEWGAQQDPMVPAMLTRPELLPIQGISPLESDDGEVVELPRQLYGISCNKQGFVEKMSIPGNNVSALGGIFPLGLGLLSELVSVRLACNDLALSRFPSQIFNCTKLRVMDLTQCGIGASEGIPEQVGQLQQLEILKLGNNVIGGVLPAALFTCAKLERIDLSGNMLRGCIPGSIGECTSLQELRLQGNNIEGEIPAAIGGCTNLRHLDISDNSLTGGVTSALSKYCTRLSVLDLHYNRLNERGVAKCYSLFKIRNPKCELRMMLRKFLRGGDGAAYSKARAEASAAFSGAL